MSKAGRTSETADAFQIHSRKPRITRVRAPDPKTIEPTLPPHPKKKKYWKVPRRREKRKKYRNVATRQMRKEHPHTN